MTLSRKSPSLQAMVENQYETLRIISPFRYPGGKFYAVKFIMPFLNCVLHDEYREPFVGGGSIFFSKPHVKYNWLNDFNKDLITTYTAIASQDIRSKLISMLSNEVATKERHSEVKQIRPRDIVEIAFKTYYLNRTSYSGIIHKPSWGYETGQSAPPETWGEKIACAGKKLENVKLTALDFEEVIMAHAEGESVLMYLDPPYYNSDQKRAYEHSFTREDHERLERILRKTPYKFCLSYDDCEEIRDMYSWANFHKRSWLYNTANCRGTTRSIGRELIITNYSVKEQSQLTLDSVWNASILK